MPCKKSSILSANLIPGAKVFFGITLNYSQTSKVVTPKDVNNFQIVKKFLNSCYFKSAERCNILPLEPKMKCYKFWRLTVYIWPSVFLVSLINSYGNVTLF